MVQKDPRSLLYDILKAELALNKHIPKNAFSSILKKKKSNSTTGKKVHFQMVSVTPSCAKITIVFPLDICEELVSTYGL